MDFADTLWLVGIGLEAILLATLYLRGAWRKLPLFTIYCAWDFLNNSLLLVFSTAHNVRSEAFAIFFLATSVLDAVCILAVLTEIFWSVLRPLHATLPRHTILILTVFLCMVAALLWPFTAIAGFGRLTSLTMHIQQVSSLLRIIVFALLAVSSHFLSLGWRDRELQVATGLGFYSLVSFGAMLVHTHSTSLSLYISLNEFVVASYLCSLLYWVYSFAQKEAERREFTPQMQNLLLAIAGVAREQRLALAQAAAERSRSES